MTGATLDGAERTSAEGATTIAAFIAAGCAGPDLGARVGAGIGAGVGRTYSFGAPGPNARGKSSGDPVRAPIRAPGIAYATAPAAANPRAGKSGKPELSGGSARAAHVEMGDVAEAKRKGRSAFRRDHDLFSIRGDDAVDLPGVVAPSSHRQRMHVCRSLGVDLADLGERWRRMDGLDRRAAGPHRQRAEGSGDRGERPPVRVQRHTYSVTFRASTMI